ncbi:MAG TPA: PASTA domain-containing protein [Gaiellaceae bacterium]|nr:PASTA domain-containing protein [Gaiellaceae bacterium]
MTPRDPYEGRTEVIREEDVPPPAGPPPWWREHWWIGPLLLLVVVGALLAFAFLRDGVGDDRTAVPDVVGLSEVDARERVEAAGLDVQVTEVEAADPRGEVVAQEPGAGNQLAEGQTVLLSVSTGEAAETEAAETEAAETEPAETETQPETETETVTETETQAETETEPPPTQTETVTKTETVEEAPEPTDMPDVTGADFRDAAAQILDAGLLPQSYAVDSGEPQGTVVAQNPAGGTRLSERTPVRINVSLGPGGRAEGAVPDFRDQELGEALRRCHGAGFTCRFVERSTTRAAARGRIIGQQPAPGVRAASLSQITLAVGR